MCYLANKTYLLFEQVLPVLERTQLDLPLFVLQLNVWELEIGDEVVEGLEDLLDGQKDHRPVLKTQTVEVSKRMQKQIYVELYISGSAICDQFSITHIKTGDGAGWV